MVRTPYFPGQGTKILHAKQDAPPQKKMLDNGAYPTEWLPRLNDVIHAIHTAQCIYSESRLAVSDSL